MISCNFTTKYQYATDTPPSTLLPAHCPKQPNDTASTTQMGSLGLQACKNQPGIVRTDRPD